MKRHLTHIVIAGAATAALLLATGVGLGQALAFAILIACPVTFGVLLWLEHQQDVVFRKPTPGSNSEPSGDPRSGDHPSADSPWR